MISSETGLKPKKCGLKNLRHNSLKTSTLRHGRDRFPPSPLTDQGVDAMPWSVMLCGIMLALLSAFVMKL